MSKGNCETIINYIISIPVLNLITAFQQYPTLENYNNMVEQLWGITSPSSEQYYKNNITIKLPDDLIIYITVADGSLAYNSAANSAATAHVDTTITHKNTNTIITKNIKYYIDYILKLNETDQSLSPGLNSFYNYQSFNIFPGNNNFNTRKYAMTAILSSTDGIGVEQRWSTLLQKNVTYYAYRTGFSQQQCFGLIIVCLPAPSYIG